MHTIFENPLASSSLTELLGKFLQAIVYLGSLALLIAFIWVGLLFVQAQGRPEDLKKARAALLWTVVGGIIILGAQAVASIIAATGGALAS